MVVVMSQDTKDRIANLERQKIELNATIERLSYSGNHKRMLEFCLLYTSDAADE